MMKYQLNHQGSSTENLEVSSERVSSFADGESTLSQDVALSRRSALRSILGSSAFAIGWVSPWASLLGGCGDEIAGERLPKPLDADPSLLALLQGVSCPLDLQLDPYRGVIPRLQGHAFVMGPIPSGGEAPIFNGDGALMRFSMTDGALTVCARRLMTPCARLDDAATDTEFAYKNHAMIRESKAFGMRTFLNTAPVPALEGRLMATYDAGRPWEVDPESLELITPIGGLDQWKTLLPPLTDAQRFSSQVMSTAHPALDEHTHQVFSVNYAPHLSGINVESFLDLLWWGTDGEVKRTRLVNSDHTPCVLQMSCHQIQVTARYIILIDSAVLIEPEQLLGHDITRPQLAVTPVIIVERAALIEGGNTQVKQLTIPSESAHFLAAYDDSEGIDLLLVHQCSSDPSEWVRAQDTLAHGGEPVNPAYTGLPVSGADRLWLGRYHLDAEAEVATMSASLHGDELWGITLWTQDPRADKAQLGEGWWVCQGWRPELFTARIAEAYHNQENRTLPFEDLPSEAQPTRVLRVDHESLTIIDEYVLPEGYIPLSPTFMPAMSDDEVLTSGEGSGAIITLIQGPEGSEVWIFDALDLKRGPVAQVRDAELNFGFTLHSAWLESKTPPPAPYHISAVEELRARFQYLSPEARLLAESALGLSS